MEENQKEKATSEIQCEVEIERHERKTKKKRNSVVWYLSRLSDGDRGLSAPCTFRINKDGVPVLFPSGGTDRCRGCRLLAVLHISGRRPRFRQPKLDIPMTGTAVLTTPASPPSSSRPLQAVGRFRALLSARRQTPHRRGNDKRASARAACQACAICRHPVARLVRRLSSRISP